MKYKLLDKLLWMGSLVSQLENQEVDERVFSNGTVSTSSIIQIQGSSIGVEDRAEQATELRVVAIDSNGREMPHFTLPIGTKISLHVRIEGDAQLVKMSQGTLVVDQCANIGELKNSQGSIRVERCGNVNSVRTSQGNITIDNCEVVKETRTSQGSIRINGTRQ